MSSVVRLVSAVDTDLIAKRQGVKTIISAHKKAQAYVEAALGDHASLEDMVCSRPAVAGFVTKNPSVHLSPTVKDRSGVQSFLQEGVPIYDACQVGVWSLLALQYVGQLCMCPAVRLFRERGSPHLYNPTYRAGLALTCLSRSCAYHVLSGTQWQRICCLYRVCSITHARFPGSSHAGAQPFEPNAKYSTTRLPWSAPNLDTPIVLVSKVMACPCTPLQQQHAVWLPWVHLYQLDLSLRT